MIFLEDFFFESAALLGGEGWVIFVKNLSCLTLLKPTLVMYNNYCQNLMAVAYSKGRRRGEGLASESRLWGVPEPAKY